MILFLSNFSGCGDRAVTAAWKHSCVPTSERVQELLLPTQFQGHLQILGTVLGWAGRQQSHSKWRAQTRVLWHSKRALNRIKLLPAPSTGQRCKTEILLSRESLTPALKEAQGLGK